MYRRHFKHGLDFLIGLIALIIILPIFILIVAILFLTNRGNPFIVQKRPGINGRIIKVLKFKTMNDKCGEDGSLLPDKLRLTKVGIFLRKASLDEIPQLINVIKGDMSIVGPRPLALQYYPFFTEREHLRHTVKPGITGLAQINGRNGLDWETKFNYDVEYVDNISFLLDIKIMYKTISKVLSRENIGVIGIDAPEDFDKYRQKQSSAKTQQDPL
jgi:undecaprenyl phosphate N,N'-diacetylbacillosamine 1-phosphate transferase